MKKTIFILCLFAAMVTTAHAQPFQKGTSIIQGGIGIGSNLGGLGNGRPAIAVGYEYGMWEVGGPGVISLGGYFGNLGNDFANYNVIGVRSAYHYNGITDVPELDVYGGAMLAYNNVSVKGLGTFNYGSGVGLSLYIGSRYFFTENFGAFAELGYGVSTLSVGVAFKF